MALCGDMVFIFCVALWFNYLFTSPYCTTTDSVNRSQNIAFIAIARGERIWLHSQLCYAKKINKEKVQRQRFFCVHMLT